MRVTKKRKRVNHRKHKRRKKAGNHSAGQQNTDGHGLKKKSYSRKDAKAPRRRRGREEEEFGQDEQDWQDKRREGSGHAQDRWTQVDGVDEYGREKEKRCARGGTKGADEGAEG